MKSEYIELVQYYEYLRWNLKRVLLLLEQSWLGG